MDIPLKAEPRYPISWSAQIWLRKRLRPQKLLTGRVEPPWFAESRHRWPDVCDPSEVSERVYQAWRNEMDRRRDFRRESRE